MAEETQEQRPAGALAADMLGRSTGVVVFAVGIVLLVMVFVWAYQLFNGIEHYIDTIGAHQVASTAAGHNSSPNPGTVAGSRSLAQVTAIIGLKIAAIFALGYCASLMAGKGVQMVAAHRGKPTE